MSVVYQRAAVVIPAHNEAEHLPLCLRAVLTAATRASLPVSVVAVLDDCDDGTEAAAASFGSAVEVVMTDVGNVGAARAAGFHRARELHPGGPTWFATTDADSVVDPDWLVRQLRADADMVLGVVRVSNWRGLPPDVVRRYLARYRARRHPDGHGHVHGANMGFRADAYWDVGGFRALPTGEDVDLVDRFEAASLRIRRDTRLSVATSSRLTGRAPRGFARHLRDLTDGSPVRVKDSV
ncbi:glycosyltransferase [Mycolicibacterium confluentis]|nr:glycosyltransferase [Mycolicibacterium confluentis]MCV7320323.1 glycosyltransferase [Mycolicibacterium confluentis]ORV34825.1 glycosyl transferase [Mycolicibacterium confluentis]